MSAQGEEKKIAHFLVEISGMRKIDGLDWFRSDVSMCYAF